MNTYEIETWNLGHHYQGFMLHEKSKLQQASKGENCPFYDICCHGNEINTRNFSEGKV